MKEEIRQFVGQFEHTVDAVNRLVIPSKWRTGESEEFIMLVRSGDSIAVLTQAELMKIMQIIDSDPKLSPREKRDKRQIFSRGNQVTCDKQGRITMDADQLGKIGVKGEVVLVGGVERFDIWNPKAWKRREPELDAKSASTLDELGI